MEGKRTVISQSRKRTSIPSGSGNYYFTEQVVYRGDFGSRTKHEKVKDQNARRRELNS
jgi:hypothetical protein